MMLVPVTTNMGIYTMKTKQMKHAVMLVIGGALALGLAGCGKHEGPYSGHSEKFFYGHTAASSRQFAWCKKHNPDFQNKTCRALVQAANQHEMHTFFAPSTSGQNAMGSGKDINLGNTAQFNPLAK